MLARGLREAHVLYGRRPGDGETLSLGYRDGLSDAVDPSFVQATWNRIQAGENLERRCSGFYNDNYTALTPEGELVIFRVPRVIEFDLEPRQFLEGDLLRWLVGRVSGIPVVSYIDPKHRFQIHRFVDGQTMQQRYPTRVRLPEAFIPRIAQFISEVFAAGEPPPDVRLPTSSFHSANAGVFFGRLIEWENRIWARRNSRHAAFFEWIGVTSSPFRIAGQMMEKIDGTRALRLCHGDNQKFNLMVSHAGELCLLDWELALWADPVWELATHTHRMHYLPEDEHDLLEDLLDMGAVHHRDLEDLEAYFTLESIKSIVNDGIRYVDASVEGVADDLVWTFAREYERKLALAAQKIPLTHRCADELYTAFTRLR